MSEPSRADRRRHQRGGSSAPPTKRRDPMGPIYIGFVVLIVLVLAGFGITRMVHQHQLTQAYATPTPGPNASAKPIALTDLQPIGKPFEKTPQGASANTKQGGQGSPVDGVTCMTTEGVKLHIHSHLALYVNGTQMQIPQAIGIVPQPASPSGGCLYWVHTHGTDGIIHVEAPELSPPGGGSYTLGLLFDIWGQPLSKTQVGPFKGDVTAFVNGSRYDEDLRSIPLYSHQQIVLEVGKPVVDPPNYAFPPND
ncbi:MAG: hypothetical protein ACXVAO_19260 [Vulcanimicrobiaceae bacterium]